MNRIDHFAWSSPSLGDAIADLERWSGVRACPGGSHPGMGTRNALVSLGPGLYLALDGPDPEQVLRDNNGARMAAQGGYNMDLFAVATDDIEGARKLLGTFGIDAEIRRGSRDTPDGRELRWRHLAVGPTPFGCALPHVAQWDTHDHPSREAPGGCTLGSFVVGHPSPRAVVRLYEALGLSVDVVAAPEPVLRVGLRGRRGPFDLPTGFTMRAA